MARTRPTEQLSKAIAQSYMSSRHNRGRVRGGEGHNTFDCINI